VEWDKDQWKHEILELKKADGCISFNPKYTIDLLLHISGVKTKRKHYL